MIRAFLVALILFITVFPARAAHFSGEYLMQVCASDENGKELTPGSHITCQAYIAGVMDYHTLIRSLGTAPSVDFCVPKDEGLSTIQQKVLAYLFRNRHEQGPFIAAPAVALALHKAYPCDGKKKSRADKGQADSKTPEQKHKDAVEAAQKKKAGEEGAKEEVLEDPSEAPVEQSGVR